MLRDETFAYGVILPSAKVNSIEDHALGIAQVPGIWVPPSHVRCVNGTDIKIGAVAGMMLGNINSTLATASESTYTPSSPTHNTLFYLYAIFSSGTINFEHSTTGVDATGNFKSGDTERRYITTFRVNDAGTIVPFEKIAGRYLYRGSAISDATDLRALSGGNQTSFTGIVLSDWIPEYSRIALIGCEFSPRIDNIDFAYLGTFGDTATFPRTMKMAGVNGGGGSGAASDDSIFQDMEIITDENGEIQYKVTHANDALTVFILGYQDKF